jgi:hypothetical protein
MQNKGYIINVKYIHKYGEVGGWIRLVKKTLLAIQNVLNGNLKLFCWKKRSLLTNQNVRMGALNCF